MRILPPKGAHDRLKKHLSTPIVVIGALLCFIIGIIGIILPVLPGIPFIIAGFVLLSSRFERAKKWEIYFRERLKDGYKRIHKPRNPK